MLKATAQDAPGPVGTKAKIIEAALDTLKTDGFAGASARAIARRGDFNQALVFYHFGSVTNLLVAALDETSRRRMTAYRASLEETHTPQELVDIALRVYREDIASGHITVLAEMIAGSISSPELKQQIVARMEPWIDLAEDAVRKAIAGSFLADIVSTRELAYAVVALYLGVEMLSHLEEDQARVDELFSTAASLSALVSPLLASDR